MKSQFLLFTLVCIFAFDIDTRSQYLNEKLHSSSRRVKTIDDPSRLMGVQYPLVSSFLKQTQRNSLAQFCSHNSQKMNRLNSSIDLKFVPLKRKSDNTYSYQWKWDTIICYNVASGSEPFQRVTRKYSYSGDSIIQLMERRLGSFAWGNFARETFTFDSTGSLLTYFSERWLNNVWVNFEKREYVYNSNGDWLDWKFSSWQSTAWEVYDHHSWHYNANGLFDTCVYQKGQSGLLVNFYCWVPTYDGNGYITKEMGFNWINNNWVYSYQENYTIDPNGHHLTGLRQDWVNSSWLNSFYYFWTWDPSGNWLSTLRQEWQSNAWVNVELMTNIYDGNGNNILYLDQNWFNGAWVNSFQSLYVYDTSNNLISKTVQDWDNSTWLNSDFLQFTYDSMGNSMTAKYLVWYQNAWRPYDGNLPVYADHKQDIVLQEVYRYEAQVDSILVSTRPVNSPTEIKLFPNPAHASVYVAWPNEKGLENRRLLVYDLKGNLIFSKLIFNNITPVDLSNLVPGVYVLMLQNDKFLKVLKLVKD